MPIYTSFIIQNQTKLFEVSFEYSIINHIPTTHESRTTQVTFVIFYNQIIVTLTSALQVGGEYVRSDQHVRKKIPVKICHRKCSVMFAVINGRRHFSTSTCKGLCFC